MNDTVHIVTYHSDLYLEIKATDTRSNNIPQPSMFIQQVLIGDEVGHTEIEKNRINHHINMPQDKIFGA